MRARNIAPIASALILWLVAARAADTSGPATAAFSCPAPTSCEALASSRTDVEAEWQRRLEAEAYDDLSAPSECSVALTERAVAECGADLCTEICRLDPCDTHTAETYVSLCEQERPDAEAHMHDILRNAAATPGFCGCDACPTTPSSSA
jgi:hypothetical protein